ncbi:hypothetical protein HanPSC8_Chr03g0099501 [Helianthus annuus]|nr:hypothetical protein HanPSC8_Chr03g0099491 [Helianthus annuus]KAJ0943060.1 hypothetical protein HanPSC8_Chr03g0099501 [Helianthus annuus]
MIICDVVDPLLVYLSILLSAEQTQIVRYMELAQRGAGRCGQGSYYFVRHL